MVSPKTISARTQQLDSTLNWKCVKPIALKFGTMDRHLSSPQLSGRLDYTN